MERTSETSSSTLAVRGPISIVRRDERLFGATTWPRTMGKGSRYRSEDSLVFGHPVLGTAVDPTKLSRDYMRPALKAAGITKPFRPWHDLRHTALTHEAAAGNPHAYVQAKAGHSQSTITDRYIHAAQVLFPGAAEKAEERMFGTRR